MLRILIDRRTVLKERGSVNCLVKEEKYVEIPSQFVMESLRLHMLLDWIMKEERDRNDESVQLPKQ